MRFSNQLVDANIEDKDHGPSDYAAQPPCYSISIKGILLSFPYGAQSFYRSFSLRVTSILKMVASATSLPTLFHIELVSHTCETVKLLRVLRIILLSFAEHPDSDTESTHNEDGSPSRVQHQTALGRSVLMDPEDQVMVEMEIPRLSVESQFSGPMLTLNVFNQRHHDNQKTYNTASATLISNVMIKRSVSMPVQKSQRQMKVMLPNKDDQEN
ncbi:hypothetical protein Tco_0111937 [Tanacetum coccineum]